MNYGIAVCKLKPFEPPKYRIAAAARHGTGGGRGWQARDPASKSGPVALLCDLGQVAPSCSVPQFLSVEDYTCLTQAKSPHV